MGWNEACTVLGCAVAGLDLGVGIVLTAGALAAPCGAAIWAVTVVEGTTALTAAGCSALAVAGAGGAKRSKPGIRELPREEGVSGVTQWE